MQVTLSEVKDKVESILQREEHEYEALGNEEHVNHFLDNILTLKAILKDRITKVEELDSAFAELTWFDNYPKKIEADLSSLIERAFKFHNQSIVLYANLNKKFSKPRLFKQELGDYKLALDDFEDTVLEVKEILFDFRKDVSFMNLFDNLE